MLYWFTTLITGLFGLEAFAYPLAGCCLVGVAYLFFDLLGVKKK